MVTTCSCLLRHNVVPQLSYKHVPCYGGIHLPGTVQPTRMKHFNSTLIPNMLALKIRMLVREMLFSLLFILECRPTSPLWLDPRVAKFKDSSLEEEEEEGEGEGGREEEKKIRNVCLLSVSSADQSEGGKGPLVRLCNHGHL